MSSSLSLNSFITFKIEQQILIIAKVSTDEILNSEFSAFFEQKTFATFLFYRFFRKPYDKHFV